MGIDFSGLLWFGLGVGVVLGAGGLALFWWLGPWGLVIACVIVAAVVGWILAQ